jgi:hypothetical protein
VQSDPSEPPLPTLPAEPPSLPPTEAPGPELESWSRAVFPQPSVSATAQGAATSSALQIDLSIVLASKAALAVEDGSEIARGPPWSWYQAAP